MAWSAGAIPTATQLNTYIPQSSTTWSSPIAGGITAGNGTTAAVYSQVGPLIFCYFKFTLGSTSSITGAVSLDLPFDTSIQRLVGSATYFDTSGSLNREGRVAQGATNASVALEAFSDAATPHIGPVALSSTVPFTWATGDILLANFWYFA